MTTTNETRAAVLYELGAPLKVVSLGIPELKPGQVLVNMVFSGVCHTQLSEARGLRGPDRFIPHAMGHEGSGVVAQVGEGVTKVKPGDRVVLSWIKGSGAEVPSTIYAGPDGSVNSGAITTFMERTVIAENRLTIIPDAMPLREAALLGCAVQTGAGSVLNSAGLKEGQTIAIYGVGGIGLSAVMAAHLTGASKVIAVDVVDAKLQQASEFGATHQVDAREGSPVDAIRELTDGKGVDFSVEAAGLTQTMEAAFESVRDGGGLCVLAGNPPVGQRIAINPFDLIRGKRIVGTWGGESVPDRDIPRYCDLFLSGKLPLDKLVTHTYALDDINQAMDDLEHQRVGRALLEIEAG